MRRILFSASAIVFWTLLVGLLVPVFLAGCAGQSAELEGRVSRLERDRATLVGDLRREQKRLQRLQAEIEKATGYLRNNGARLTAQLDELRAELTSMRGEVEVISHRMANDHGASARNGQAIDHLGLRLDRLIADLRDRAGIAILALPRDLPERAEDWVTLAQRRFDEGQVRVAEAIARECGKRFGGTEPGARCGLLLAKVAYEEHRFVDAVTVLQGVHDAMGGKPVPVVGEALLAISAVLEAEGKCKEAMGVLDYLRKDMPRLPQSREARARKSKVQKRCKVGVRRLPDKTSGTLKVQPEASPALPPESAVKPVKSEKSAAKSSKPTEKSEKPASERTKPTLKPTAEAAKAVKSQDHEAELAP